MSSILTTIADYTHFRIAEKKNEKAFVGAEKRSGSPASPDRVSL